MRDLIICLMLMGKRFLRKPGFLLSIILLPICIYQIGSMTQTEDSGWQVALYTEEAGLSEAVIEKMTGYGELVQYHVCNSEEELQREIKSKRAECGVVFREGFEQAFYDLKFDEQITIFYAPSSVAQKMVREEVFSTILAQANETILVHFMEEQSGDTDQELLNSIYKKYTEDGNVFQFRFEEIPDVEEAGGQLEILLSPTRGMLAIYIWAEALLSILLFYQDEKNGILHLLPRVKRRICKLGILGIPTGIAMVISFCLLYISHVQNGLYLEPLVVEAGYLLALGLLSVLSSYCLYRLCCNEVFYVLVITILLLASVILCPIFFSLDFLFPELSRVQYVLIPGAYLEHFMGRQSGMLWGEILLFMIVNTLLFVKRKGTS